MQPYPWRTLYLEPPFCVRFGTIHLITWFRWGSLFLFKTQSSKVFENWFFQLLARSWFWWQLVSIQNSIEKAFKNWFFQLLARSWFWWQLVSIQISVLKNIQKLFQLLARSWFWRQLFSAKKLQKKIQKGYLLQTQPYPWWTLYILRTSLLYQIWAFPSDSDETGWKKRHDVLCFRDFWHL